ncbi:MAG: translation initiation factor IF-3 [Deltaproteobacteria bacterium]|nr:translation initiation factor IF-3 [Deltaproteobacteria bacterium]
MPRNKRPREDDKQREPRVDRRIRVPEVLVIDSTGEKLGVLATHEALQRARDQNLNLVEVAPNSRPPVCRILDYGKYKYEQKRAQKQKKKNQVVVEIKEVKFRPKIERHDYEFKVRHVVRFLSEGNKVKCTIMFRGRELAHTELGAVMLRKVLGDLEGKVVVEQPPRLEGRNMSMMIAPKPGAWPKPQRGDAAAGKAEDDDLDEDLNDDLEDDLDDEGDSELPHSVESVISSPPGEAEASPSAREAEGQSSAEV